MEVHFYKMPPSCTGAVEVGCAQLPTQIYLIFPVSTDPAAAFLCWKVASRPLPQRMETKDLRSFSCHRGITWCGGSVCREERFSIYQSLLMFLEEKRGPGGRSCSVTHCLSTLLLNQTVWSDWSEWFPGLFLSFLSFSLFLSSRFLWCSSQGVDLPCQLAAKNSLGRSGSPGGIFAWEPEGTKRGRVRVRTFGLIWDQKTLPVLKNLAVITCA